MTKVALITGGASGMGFAAAEKLIAQGNWEVHIVDLDPKRGAEAVAALGGEAVARFHQANVTSYDSLGSVFKAAFQSQNRLDFVFANAGIAERANFYMSHDTGVEPPPLHTEMDLIVDIDLKSVINTAYLAQHYFRLAPPPAGDSSTQSLLMTASCGGLYPSSYSPIYSASKHAVVGLARSIARHFWNKSHVRVNALCPGTVRTNLLDAAEWNNFPDDYFTPVSKIADVVLMLVEGNGQATGSKNPELWGHAVEVSGKNHYFRDAPEFLDEGMRQVMGSTEVEELKH